MTFINKTFNHLTIISEPYYDKKHRYKIVKCICTCGKETNKRLSLLLKYGIKSCGCARNKSNKSNAIKHGLSTHKLYIVWKRMKDRCLNKNCKNYKNYGGRGITICDEWLNDFKSFYDWAIDKWQTGLVIDRINNDGNYEPDNCRFTTYKISANNTRQISQITIFNETKNLQDWILDSRCKTNIHTFKNRINTLNWTAEEALTTP